MNRLLSVFLILISGVLVASSQSVSGDSNNNGIRDEVDNVIVSLIREYSFTNPQISAAFQVALSQQNILNTNPSTREQAATLARRDAAATNCASTRFQSTTLEIIYSRIESATFNTGERQNIYNRYTSLLGEDDNFIPATVAACEDQFGNTTINFNNTNQNTNPSNPNNTSNNFNPSGIVADNNINYPCLVLTKFLEYGSRDSQVLNLQKFLVDTGYMEMYPTGYFGRNTEAAVRLWQARHNIDIRGYVGPSTRASIASVTCRGDQASIERARLGPALRVSTSAAPRPVTTRPSNSNTTSGALVNPIPASTIIIPTTINTNTQNNTNTTNSSRRLSQTSGTFNTNRNPVNTLYFSYRYTSANEVVSICFERAGANTCSNVDSFTPLAAQYKPGSYDAIPNGDRWLINLYYSAANYPSGGKVYLKTANTSPEVFTFINSSL